MDVVLEWEPEEVRHGTLVGKVGKTKGGVGLEIAAPRRVKPMTSLENILFSLEIPVF